MLLLSFTSTIAAGQKASLKYYTNIAGDNNAYYEILPAGYNAAKSWPVLIFLHGRDEKAWKEGMVHPDILKVGLPPVLLSGKLKFPGICVIPQCQVADWDHYYSYNKFHIGSVNDPGAMVKDLYVKLRKKYHIDTTRVYITGISMGGGGAMSFIQENPSLAAGAIVIAGWGDPAKINHLSTAVWIFQGETDGGADMKSLGEKIVKSNPSVKNHAPTIYAGKGHGIWDQAYATPGLFDWLASHKLK